MELLAELTRCDVAARAADSLLLIPTAATEQHGPHLPLATDTLIGEAIVRLAGEALGDSVPVMVAPTLAYGNSHHHLAFNALSLSTTVYLQAITDILVSAVKSGFRYIFFVNSHGGNDECLKLASREIVLTNRAAVGACSYWHVSRTAIAESGLAGTGSVPGHAGQFETNLLLAIAPELVHLDRLPKETKRQSFQDAVGVEGLAAQVEGDWRRFDGFTDMPADPSPELGERILGVVTQAVAASITSFYQVAKVALK